MTKEESLPDLEPQALEPSQVPVYTIRDLAQLKALADPLRVRILEALCEAPRTTKQVAEQLGEKPTKLYHHVEALDKAGLIKLHSTRPNRGTLEKYFRAVAQSFRADSEIFSADPAATGWTSLGAELLTHSANEIQALEGKDLEGREPMLAQLKITTSPEHIKLLQEKIQKLMDEIGREGDKHGDEEEQVEYQMILALYPVFPST